MRREPKTPDEAATDTLVMVFARAPVAGRCKTRLIPRYGARGAARLHRRLADRTLATAMASGYAVELWCEPASGHGYFQACRRRWPLKLQRQCRGDLGAKMARAIHSGLARGWRRVLVVGTDCAALTADHLQTAAAALAEHDCVLQPALDGGYVLIGARRALLGALRNIDWSSGKELRQTFDGMRHSGLSCQLLPPLWDVDHARDVRRARREKLL